MSNPIIGGNGQAGNANFFAKHIVAHNPLNPREVTVSEIAGSGISPRDYFAAQVLSGQAYHSDVRELAAYAYRVADAMIEVRNQTLKVHGKTTL